MRIRTAFVTLILAGLPAMASAQTKRSSAVAKPASNAPATQSSGAAPSDGPSKAATQQWIASEMPPLTKNSYDEVSRAFGSPTRSTNWKAITQTQFRDDCTLTYHKELGFVLGGVSQSSTYEVSVPLKDVDPGSLSVRQAPVLSASTTRTGDAYEVLLRLKASAGQTITSMDLGSRTSRNTDLQTLPVTDASSGERVVNALKRAAALCGAGTSAF